MMTTTWLLFRHNSRQDSYRFVATAVFDWYFTVHPRDLPVTCSFHVDMSNNASNTGRIGPVFQNIA